MRCGAWATGAASSRAILSAPIMWRQQLSGRRPPRGFRPANSACRPEKPTASGVIALLGLLSFWALGFLWAWMTVGSAQAAFIGFDCAFHTFFTRRDNWLWQYWQQQRGNPRCRTVMLLATVLLLVMVHYPTGVLTPFERNTLAATSLAAVALRPLVRRRTPWGHAMLERASA